LDIGESLCLITFIFLSTYFTCKMRRRALQMAVRRAFSTAPDLSEMLTVTKSCAKVTCTDNCKQRNRSSDLALDLLFSCVLN
jgi:hypothetical protein